MMSRRKVSQSFFVLLTVLGAASCSRPTGEEFPVPEVVSMEAKVEGASATFTVAFSNDRMEECGIELQDGEALTTLPGTLRGNTFSVTADKLEAGRQYTWSAYAKAGRSIIHSGSATFKVTEGLIPIPDSVFKNWLVSNGFDTDGDGEINYAEAQRVTVIDIYPTDHYNLQSLKGIEYMPNLMEIICWGSWWDNNSTPEGNYHRSTNYYWSDCWGPIGTLRFLDVSNNPKLRVLDVYNNAALGEEIVTLDLSHNPELRHLNINANAISISDISNNLKLQELFVSYCPDIASSVIPFLPHLANLEVLECDQNGLGGTLDLSGNTKLRKLSCLSNSISELFLPASLRELSCWDNPLGSLDVSNLTGLYDLACANTGLTSLDVTHNQKLIRLAFNGNNLGRIDLSHNPELEEIACWDCGLSSLDLSYNPKLTWVRCWGNKLQTLDVSNNLRLGTRESNNPHDNGLVCPYGESRNYLLMTLYIADGQVIPFINDGNRSEEHIPATTQIVNKPPR